jgi:DNA repair protein SbcC/Rad50
MAERSDAEARGRDHVLEEQPTLVRELEERESQARAATLRLDQEAADLRASEALLDELDARRQTFDRDRGEEDQLIDRSRSEEERARRLEARGRDLDRETSRWTEALGRSGELARQREELVAFLLRLDERLLLMRAEREARGRDLADLSGADARLASVREALRHGVEERDRADREANELDQELKRLLAEGPQKEPPAPTRRTVPEIERSLEEARARAESSLASISRLEHIAAENEELRTVGICPRCHQKVDPAEFAVHFQEVAEELARDRVALGAARSEIEALGEERKSRERYERSLQRWTDLESARRSARDRTERAAAQRLASVDRVDQLGTGVRTEETEVARLRPRADGARAVLDELARLESERTAVETHRMELSKEVDEARGADATLARLAAERSAWVSETAELERQQTDRRAALQRLRDRLAGLPRLAEEILAARARRESARSAIAQTERSLERARTLVESHRARLADIDALIRERQERLDAATRHRELATWFGQAFREAVLSLEHRLLARAQAEFERELARFFTILVEDPALIARCDAAFSPAVEIDGEWTPAEALSGGERTALALAFRLALGQVVRGAGRLKLESLILDEPTDGFSPEQVVRMGELLDGLGLPQVLLVSHEVQLAAIADRVVRVQKEGGRSVLQAGAETASLDGSGSAGQPAAPIGARRRVRSPRLDAPAPGRT